MIQNEQGRDLRPDITKMNRGELQDYVNQQERIISSLLRELKQARARKRPEPEPAPPKVFRKFRAEVAGAA